MLTAFVGAGARGGRTAELDFDRQVAPILAGRCMECHSGAEPKGKLDLTSAAKTFAGGESGSAIEAGKPSASNLWQRIVADEMPPKHPLPAGEREIIRQWIAAGAKWGTDPIDPFRYTSAARAGYDWWSLQPLVAASESSSQNSIDKFVVVKLKDAGLVASTPVDRRTLIRRLYFDLVGLPPTAEELNNSETYEAIVERLLQSPHYGERWARHWLDVVHFGESDGFEYDKMRPHAWRYRDWVIDALNRDLPFDEFARLQIAGDVLRPGDQDAIIATGFLVGGVHDSLLPKGETMQMIMRQDELEDLVGLVGQTFLGLTVNCARCHDHKFDPIRQADYYRLAAALAGVKRGNRDIPATPPAELLAQHAQASQALSEIEKAARTAALAKRKADAERRPAPPRPLAQWDFETDASDTFGTLNGTVEGVAKFGKGAITVDGRTGHVVSTPLVQDLRAKTLEAWVQLGHLEQRAGGVIGVETLDGKIFDTIVFGEKQPKRWIAGSNNFARTQAIDKATDESEAANRAVHLAAVYDADGTIRLYREGQPYGLAYQSQGPVVFPAGKSHVVLGLRHSPSGGSKMLDGKIETARLYDRALSPDEVEASFRAVSNQVSEAELVAEMNEFDRQRYAMLKAKVEALAVQVRDYRDRKAFAVTPQTPPVMRLLARGNVQQPGEPIAPAGIESLSVSEPEFGLAADANDAERRTKLAAWIASEKNPLFARTIVNRVWQYHFGRGLVETPSDLGFSGGRSSHPELLDFLANELIANKWSLKALHRVIVTSATYRQASRPRAECLAVDADNRLLWRFSPRRLEAECVRDAMLSVSGQLNEQRGGPSYMDFRPYVYKTTQYYDPIDPIGTAFNRRSIYRFWARGGRNPLLDTFDCPDPATAAPRRGSTTTPLQALSLLNNSFTLRLSEDCAERLKRERPAENAAQVKRAFELAYGRLPSDTEVDESVAFVAENGLAAFCRVLFNSNGFLYVN
ncbi:MAG TPA: DUF1553 domain-containing protein [Pirellulaceae bacterium]